MSSRHRMKLVILLPLLALLFSACEDGEPVDLLFLLVSPEDAPAEHLRSLSAISKWVKANQHVEKIRQLDDAESIYELLERETD